MSKIDKRKLKQIIHWLKAIKTWQLIGVLLVALVLTVSLLRLNNLGMVERREAVKAADMTGDQEQLREALVDLQHYVSSHMNTSLGSNGIALEHSYNRAVESWARDSSDQINPNSDVYQQASIDCQSRWQGDVESFRNDYVRCVAERVAALDGAEEDISGKPRADTYQINFASPIWSPDLAGFAVLFCLLITGVILARFSLLVVLRIVLRISHNFNKG